ncbi:hypothetical protein UP09_30220 [Bradyrhizobium sp. LTSP885]|uniref:hypothetical protein n=1 Tax=Bradyrhizobium sp. LTSP885 TaxID=1619232 RepID=UPI0005CA7124|nr:hypothetical protein [Bradyrhizobium sp. LTSP885]KJC36153.1 hypothetical protein UP09_30220 [Bradyrhizobium sp. LTSP885]
MRSVLALGLLIILCASANAAPERHPRARQPAAARPPAAVRPPADATSTPRVAVPGWSDEATRRWMDQSTHYGEGD